LADSHLNPDILLITGAREIAAFDLPRGTDCLVLPGLGKRKDGKYQSRSLSIPLSDSVQLRSQTILGALKSFKPHLLIVDKVPSGAFGELIPALRVVRSEGYTRCILGLRDVLDDPEVVQSEWKKFNSNVVVHTYYDSVWVYGDRTVYDPVTEYTFDDEIASKIRYTGYIGIKNKGGSDSAIDYRKPATTRTQLRSILCLLGGGQDGFELAENFVQAELPSETTGTIVAGPFMSDSDRARLHYHVDLRSGLRILDFVSEPERLLREADFIVSMGGYNTVCEILSYEKRALIVPRVVPRTEQLIRAERLSELGLLDCLHPDSLTPKRLSKWMDRKTESKPRAKSPINLEGLARVLQLTSQLLGHKDPAAMLS
jgi:predicted glycosyltransferase